MSDRFRRPAGGGCDVKRGFTWDETQGLIFLNQVMEVMSLIMCSTWKQNQDPEWETIDYFTFTTAPMYGGANMEEL